MVEKVKQRKQILLDQIKRFHDNGLNTANEENSILDICTEYSDIVKRVLSNPTEYNEFLDIASDIQSKCLRKSEEYSNMEKLLDFEPPNENILDNFIDNFGYIRYTDNTFDFPFNVTDTGYGFINVSWNEKGKILTKNDEIDIEYVYHGDGQTKIKHRQINNYVLLNALNKYGTYSIKIRNCTEKTTNDIFCTPYTETQTINIQKPKKGLNIDASWETNDNWKSNHITIESNNIIKSNDEHFGSIFLSNILKKGKYIYTFKIMNEDSDNIGFCLYNTQFGKPSLDDKSALTNSKYSYCFDENDWTELDYIPGIPLHKVPFLGITSNDIIKMIIDLNEYRFSFIVNQRHYPVSFSIKKSEYKVGVYFSKLVELQFISCKQIE